jgi:hypothetical protein
MKRRKEEGEEEEEEREERWRRVMERWSDGAMEEQSGPDEEWSSK